MAIYRRNPLTPQEAPALAPLAAGEYVLELAFEGNGTRDQAAYGFRIVP